MHARVAFAPHQEAGVEDHDDDDVQPQRVLDGVDHVVGDRVGHVVIELGDVGQRGDQLDDTQQHDHDEHRAGDDGLELHAYLRDELLPPGAGAVVAGHVGQGDVRHGGGRGLALFRTPIAGAFVEAEAAVGHHEHHDGHRDPEQPVPADGPIHGQQQRVLVGHRPVLGHLA